MPQRHQCIADALTRPDVLRSKGRGLGKCAQCDGRVCLICQRQPVRADVCASCSEAETDSAAPWATDARWRRRVDRLGVFCSLDSTSAYERWAASLTQRQVDALSPFDLLERRIARRAEAGLSASLATWAVSYSVPRQLKRIERAGHWIELTDDPRMIWLDGPRLCRDWSGERMTVANVDMLARRGSDGRFHIINPQTDVCLSARGAEHLSWASWWVDSSGAYRRGDMPLDEFENGALSHDRLIRYRLEYEGPQVALADVPKAERCPDISSAMWPRPDSDSPIGRMRRQLEAEFGSTCMLCRRAHATVVDHEHHTGLVRGLLCQDCNLRVDDCDCLEGCARAAYVDNPPLLERGLMYPDAKKAWRSQNFQRLVRIVNRYDEFAHLRAELPG